MSRLHSRLPVMLAASGVALSLVAFGLARKAEERGAAYRFEAAAGDRLVAVDSAIRGDVEVLESLGETLTATGEVSRGDFHILAAGVLSRHPAIHAFNWVPCVGGRKRRRIEEAVRREGFPDFSIRERSPLGGLAPAADRGEYFPVLYREPTVDQAAVLGFDEASVPSHRVALLNARATGRTTGTARVPLLHPFGEQYGFLVYAPVYRRGPPVAGPDLCPDNLLGFALGVFRIGDMVETVVEHGRQQGPVLHLFDLSAPEGQQQLYPKNPASSLADLRAGLHIERSLGVGGRRWLLVATPDAPQVGWLAWLVLAGSLILTALGTGLLHVAARQRSGRALLAQERRYHAIIESASDAIFIYDDTGTIIDVNRAAYEPRGYSRDELRGTSIMRIISAFNEATLRGLWAQVVANGSAMFESRHRRKDGSDFPVEVHLSSYEEEDGRRIFISLGRDITVRKQAEDTLRQAKEQAEAASRAKSEFLANMSHELRTPLNTVIGFSDALASGVFHPNCNLRCQGYVEDIRSAGLHLLDIINDILDVAAIEAGRLELRWEEIDTSRLAEAAMMLVRQRAVAKEVRLDRDLGAAPPRLYGDERRLKQILVNLLGNAVKFTPERGSVTLRVARGEDGGVRIAVSDTGIGMDAEGVAVALTVFGQVDSALSRKYEGTGLGLPLSQRLVEAHGGRLEIDSAPGKGTTVTVCLPPSCPAG